MPSVSARAPSVRTTEPDHVPVDPLKKRLLIMDLITEKNRQELVARMSSRTFFQSRDSALDEMRRIVEAPLRIGITLSISSRGTDRDYAPLKGTTHRRPAERDAALRRGALGDGSRD